MSRLKDRYIQELAPKMASELSIKNTMAVPRLEKIVLNIGVADAKDNQTILDGVVEDLKALAGQKPVVTKAKKSIAGFKLGKGQSVGVMVTLRGVRMYDFLDKLISVVLPKVRDFRGLSANAFDSKGNYTLGLKEQMIFPEVGFKTSGGKGRGLEISIVNSAKSKEEGKRLIEALGLPLMKGGNG